MQPIYYVKPGDVLKHYKGGHYVVLAICHNEKDPNEMLVSYLSLDTGMPWVRELSQFNQMVENEDGETVVRFDVIGEHQVLVNAGEPYGDFAVVALELPKQGE